MAERDRRARMRGFFVRYEYLIIYIAIVVTLTLVVALLDR